MASDLRYFDDIEPGETFAAGPIEVTRDAIVAFAQVYDPQPFHLDEVAARDSLLGGLCASGWHTAAVGMRLFYEAFVRHVASMGAPGIDEARWLRPLRPGDLLKAVGTVVETRPSGSRPDRGFVGISLDLRNASDDSVMTQRFVIMIQRRGMVHEGRPRPQPVPASTPGPIPADLALAAHFEELEIGHSVALGSQFFSPETITSFAAAYDPQYFHLDADQARESHFGGLIASGWQTAAYWMKHFIAAWRRSAEAREAAGLAYAQGGPSPGFDNLKWLGPVRAGDTVAYDMTLTGKRPTKRPGWGLVTIGATGRSADGATLFSFDGRMLWPMREPG